MTITTLPNMHTHVLSTVSTSLHLRKLAMLMEGRVSL